MLPSEILELHQEFAVFATEVHILLVCVLGDGSFIQFPLQAQVVDMEGFHALSHREQLLFCAAKLRLQ